MILLLIAISLSALRKFFITIIVLLYHFEVQSNSKTRSNTTIYYFGSSVVYISRALSPSLSIDAKAVRHRILLVSINSTIHFV